MSKQGDKKARELKELRSIAGLLKNNLLSHNDNSERQTQPESQTARGKFISTYIPSGGLLVWLFGVGIGSAINFFSSDPRILYLTWVCVSAWIFWHRMCLWKIAIGLLVLVLLVPIHKGVLFKRRMWALNTPESAISVSPFAGTDKSNPLDTDFSVHNLGSFSLTNIIAELALIHAVTGGGLTFDHMIPFQTSCKELPPGSDFSIQSGNYHYIAGTAQSGEIEIKVSFEDVRRPEYRISRNFHFWLKLSDDGPRWVAIK